MKSVARQHITIIWMSAVLLFFLSCGNLFAKDLQIAFPAKLPPWTLQADDAGITVEIVRDSLKIMGHQVKIKYLSLKALNHAMEPDMDAHAQVESKNLTGHYSDKIMAFQTSLISLKPSGLEVHTMNDLDDKRIGAFQNASKLFDNSFLAMTRTNPHYQEIINQELQVVRLYNGQTDLILIDKNTFLYFRQITAMTNTSMPIAYHKISGLTEESPAFVVFRDKALCNDFNTGLQRIKNNGDYHDIFYNYTK